ncbi:MAG: DUF2786 domain-containing protein [Bacteroidetes bacterium]|nr:DUF2786 domain-containing protein [Bacteroidota bacterium]
MDKKLLSKIKKLMALGKSPNANEAAAAMDKVRQLMEENKVSQQDVLLSDVGEIEKKTFSKGNTLSRWENALINCICRQFGVEVVLTSTFNPNTWKYELRVLFIGENNRVEVGSYAFEVIMRNIKSSRNEYLSSLKRFKKTNKTKLADQFCEGFVVAIQKKVSTLSIPFQEKTLIKTYMDEKYPSLEEVKHRESSRTWTDKDYDSFSAGVRTGKDSQLTAGMNGSKTKSLKQAELF